MASLCLNIKSVHDLRPCFLLSMSGRRKADTRRRSSRERTFYEGCVRSILQFKLSGEGRVCTPGSRTEEEETWRRTGVRGRWQRKCWGPSWGPLEILWRLDRRREEKHEGRRLQTLNDIHYLICGNGCDGDGEMLEASI